MNNDSIDNQQRQSLDPPAEQMKKIGYDLIDRMVEHVESLSYQRVAKRASNAEYAAKISEPIPESKTDLQNCLDFYFDNVVPDMTRVNHPRFHAFIPCPSSFAGTLGMMLAAGTNPFVGSWLGGASVAALELQVLDWIKHALQLSNHCEGILTSGGSMANLVGLSSAREKFGRSVLERGVVYVSDEGHASVDKAAQVLGFRKENIRVVATDDSYRMDLQKLASQIAQDVQSNLIPFFVSANAGTTNTGAIDDLEAIANLCNENELWFHVDAAYGGFAAMVPSVRSQMQGLDQADSITLDPHKWLYCPMGVGCAFVREREFLEGAFSTHGNYLKDLNHDEVNFLDRSPELSRPARVLPVWMVMRSTGRQKLIEQIQKDIDLANLAANLLSETEKFEVNSNFLSIVTFRHRLNENETETQRALRDDALMEATLADGELMISSTTLKGINTLRFVVMNHRTTEQDVRRSVKRIVELAS